MIPGRKIGGAQVFRVKILIVFFQERTHQHHMADARLLEFLVASQTIRELLSLVVAPCIFAASQAPQNTGRSGAGRRRAAADPGAPRGRRRGGT